MRTRALMTAVCVLLAAPAVLAEEEHRALGAHEHGHGTLNIAVEGGTIAFELDVPGMDIIGFEHEPANDAEERAVEKVESALAKGLELFALPEAAGCEQNDADVELSDVEHGATDKDGHDAGAHNAFHVVYEFACKSVGDVKRIGFGFFKTFPGSAALSVTVVTPKGQSKIEVTRDKPEADLSGLM